MITNILNLAKKLLPKRVINFYRVKIAGDNPPLSKFFNFREGKNVNLGDGELAQQFSKHQGNRVSKWLHFINIYEDLLAPYRIAAQLEQSGTHKSIRLLEIGVAEGGSLEIWKKYFGENSIIYGIDINPLCAEISTPGAQIRIGSQIDRDFLQSVINELGRPHIIIDDGSHHADHIDKTLEYLWPNLENGGVYIIEDTHTSYWKDHGGGYRKEKAFIEFAKDAIDTMHHHYTRKRTPIRTDFLLDSLASITFYDSIIVLRKQKLAYPERISFGKSQIHS